MDPNFLQQLIEMIVRMIANNETHQDYLRVTELADEYRILTTGKEIDKLLKRFIKRESEDDFALRCEITQSITPSIAASIKNPFYKVVRNERIKKSFKLKNESKEMSVQTMIDNFFGSARSNNKGLDYWLKTRKFNLSFIDPNAWVVVEWKAPESLAEVVKPYPFEVSAKQALNFEVVNDEVIWLFCYIDTFFRTSKDPNKPLKQGKKFTLYHSDVTIVFDQIDPKYFQESGGVLTEGQQIIKVKGAQSFLVSVFTPNIGYPPAFRIGYKTDDVTDGRTFVIPWHDAMPYFQKSLKTVSELDLTMSGHVFPQKIQFAPPCPGESREKTCNKGKLKDGSNCDKCQGTGYIMHEAANDVIILPMPDVDAEHVLDLEKLLVYKSPPIELVKFQVEETERLERKAHQAVFNSQMFIKKQGAAETAFEIDMNMQSIYDTLEAYTEKDSELWKEIVTVFAILCDEDQDEIDVRHNFPADFKLKTQEMLLGDLKAANESGAPSFLRDAINMDLAEITYSGDELSLLKYRTKRRFFPFNGKSEDEIMFLISSEHVSKREKILYANFEAIFVEIEAENPDFYVMADGDVFDKQYEILEKKLDEWTQAIEDERPKIQPFPGLQIPTEVEDDEEDQNAA